MNKLYVFGHTKPDTDSIASAIVFARLQKAFGIDAVAYKLGEVNKETKLTQDEKKVGLALIELFENWDDLFQEMGSNKFNKSSILLYLKEATMLTTPEIRSSMKKYKTAYYGIKKMMLES